MLSRVVRGPRSRNESNALDVVVLCVFEVVFEYCQGDALFWRVHHCWGDAGWSSGETKRRSGGSSSGPTFAPSQSVRGVLRPARMIQYCTVAYCRMRDRSKESSEYNRHQLLQRDRKRESDRELEVRRSIEAAEREGRKGVGYGPLAWTSGTQ